MTLAELLAALEKLDATPEQIEAGARELFRIGNERIGERKWEDVGHYYVDEAKACLNAALACPQPTRRVLAELVRTAQMAQAWRLYEWDDFTEKQIRVEHPEDANLIAALDALDRALADMKEPTG